jgi:regulator of replication initiation timing
MTTSQVNQAMNADLSVENGYLNGDTLYCLFQIVAADAPYQLFTFAQVCKLWSNITNKDDLWENLASKFKIVNYAKGFLKEKVVQALFEGGHAIKIVEKKRLLDYQETPEWQLRILQLRLRHPMPETQRASMASRYAEKQNEKEKRKETLMRAFEGYVHLCHVNYSRTSMFTKAEKVAHVLASEKYKMGEPWKQFKELNLTWKNEGKLPRQR